MKILLLLAIVVTHTAFTQTIKLPEPIPLVEQINKLPITYISQTPIKTDKEIVKELIKVKGIQYNVSIPLMNQIVHCESGFNPNLQSSHRYKHSRYAPVGSRELSFGAVQIHLPAHPHITKEQALNPEFAIDFLASNLAKGKGKMWSCYPRG